jgi:hypothetical protein
MLSMKVCEIYTSSVTDGSAHVCIIIMIVKLLEML